MANHRLTTENTKSPVLRIIIPRYRGKYAAGDFTDSKARTLDDRIARYLYATSRYLPWGRPQKLILEVADEPRDHEREEETVRAYHSMFKWRARGSLKKFVRQLPLVALLMAVGALLLWAAHQVEGFEWEEETAKTAGEAVRLGAWVSGWTATSLLFAQGFECLRKYFVFNQLAKAPIEFEYRRGQQTSRSTPRPHRIGRV